MAKDLYVTLDMRNEIEKLYTGLCTVYNYQNVTDPVTHQTTQELVKILEDQPCRLSRKVNPPNTNNGIPSATQTIKLFIAPEIKIPPASTLEVTQNDVTGTFTQSGIPMVYSTHQEILLLHEDYA